MLNLTTEQRHIVCQIKITFAIRCCSAYAYHQHKEYQVEYQNRICDYVFRSLCFNASSGEKKKGAET